MNIARYIFTLLIGLSSYVVCAQESQVYDKALEAYEFGRFEEVDSLLRDVVNELKGESRVNAYRLLALSSLNMDKPDEAELYVGKLLSVDPYYKAYNDAPRFADMVERLKGGKSATITTASQEAESIEETPVPVTVITEEMIHRIGARTLKEALITFVPGMTDVASNEEMNVAMRGVYSAGQEKILIMLNGHRLNSYSTNIASPDFSMSLEKVKQIEVLRGPASSIYGGVALTGVVNIITKDGLDVDGFKLKGSIGNYGQLKGDVLFGKRYMGLDVLVWGSIYNSTGEKRHLAGTVEAQPYAILPIEGDIVIGGFNRKPTFDIGLNLHYNTISIMYNRRFSKPVPALALSSGFTPYSYKKYLKWNGNAAGNAAASQHIEISYGDRSGIFSWQGKAFFDSQSQQRLQVIGDTVQDLDEFTTIFPYHSDIGIRMDKGGFQCVTWDEYTYGVKLQGGLEYKLFGSQKGNILLGGEYNYFTLNNSSYFEGLNYYEIMKTYHDEKVLATGHEEGSDYFLQVKHIFSKSFFLNMGCRYDYKKRRLGKTLQELSPRLAFIYSNRFFQVKMSYARSFVDAPYYYRSNTLDVEYGSEDLQPEILNSFQLSLMSNNTLTKGLMLDLNFFYNKGTDFIIYDGNLAYNGGKMNVGGIEFVAKYDHKRLMTEANCTWQRVSTSEAYGFVDGNRIFSIPSFQTNLIVMYELFKGLNVYAKMNATSAQSSSFTSLLGTWEVIPVPARCLVDIGASCQLRGLEFSADIRNLFNHKYVQGGGCVAPMQQQGLWFWGSVAYKF